MKFKLGVLVSIAITVVSARSFAGSGEGRARFDGTIGGGIQQFNVTSPASGFKLNNGTILTLQGEKPFGGGPLYLTGGLTYLSTTGNLNYVYASPTANYSATNVNFKDDDIRLEVGLRLKLFNSEVIRPYIEGGGLAGYTQISYDNSLRTPAVIAAGNDYKTLETVLEFGYYGEGGIELQTGTNWGLRASYRYMNGSTRNILTFNNQSVSYTGNTYYGGIFWAL